MVSYNVALKRNALLVFADIIDSSRYSAILGHIKYAYQLIKFQELFKSIGKKYFPKLKDYTQTYSHINARGDEGSVFYVSDDIPQELIYKAIEFIFELKGRLKLSLSDDEDPDPPAIGMRLGAGIHYGPVALITKIVKDRKGKNRSIIDRLEGFSINLAKRVESTSREGKYSQVFLSREAALNIQSEPILLSKNTISLKGIGQFIDVYEVQSGLFHDIPISDFEEDDERFLTNLIKLADETEKIDENWLKPLIISVIESRRKRIFDDLQRDIYYKRMVNLAWNSPGEGDPILLFTRAKECEKQGDQTLCIAYLKDILSQFPYFIPARIKLADMCWKIVERDAERAEKVFARDTAKEYLSKYDYLLSDIERDRFKQIINAA